MQQATTHGPFEVLDEQLHQHFTVRPLRQPVVIWVVMPLIVLIVLTMLVITVLEVEKGRYFEAMMMSLGILLLCAITLMVIVPLIWRPEVSVSRGQLVLRSWRGERRFSADEFDGFEWEHIPGGHRTPAYVRLWARCKRGPSLLLLTAGGDSDEQARLQAAEFVVRGLERVMAGRHPESEGSLRHGAPSSG